MYWVDTCWFVLNQNITKCETWHTVNTHNIYCFKDLPSAIVTSSTKVICGSATRLSCCVSGCPYPDKVQWQTSIDGETFISIDGWNGKYHVDSGDQYPSLFLQNTEFDDQQYYRVIVSNVFAECTSNTIFLQVIGGM